MDLLADLDHGRVLGIDEQDRVVVRHASAALEPNGPALLEVGHERLRVVPVAVAEFFGEPPQERREVDLVVVPEVPLDDFERVVGRLVGRVLGGLEDRRMNQPPARDQGVLQALGRASACPTLRGE